LPVIAFINVSCCFFERQLWQAFLKFYFCRTRRHLYLLFTTFGVKPAYFINNHCCKIQQTVVYALATVVFIFTISISGCILSRFLQFFIKTLLIALTFLCCKHRQTTVGSSSFALILNVQSHFRKSGRFTKNKPLHPAGFTTIAWKRTGKKRCNFSLLPRPPKSHLFDCFLGCSKFFPALHASVVNFIAG